MLQTQLEVVALYVGLNLVITLVLAILVVRQRAKAGVSLGSGGDAALEKAIRAHGNTVEYLAIALPGLIVLGLLGVSTLVLHVVGLLLTAGRVLHAIGITNDVTPARQFGTLATWFAVLGAGIGCLWIALA